MVAVIICVSTLVVAGPFLCRVRWGRVSVRRARHFDLVATDGDRQQAVPAMLAATSSLGHRLVNPPLVVVHRYRRDGVVRAALTIVSRYPDRVAELIAAAAGGRAEPVETLLVPSTVALRYAHRARTSGLVDEVPPEQFTAWVDAVLAGADADAIVSIGVTPAARWEDEGNGAHLRGRILAGAGDPMTAGTLVAGCGAHLPGVVPALTARRPGDGPIVVAAAALAVGAGMVMAISAALQARFGPAIAALQAGFLAAVAIAGVAALRLVRITELCWRHEQLHGLVLPARPWRLARRAKATTRRTVTLAAGQLAALCALPTGALPTCALPTGALPTGALPTSPAATPPTWTPAEGVVPIPQLPAAPAAPIPPSPSWVANLALSPAPEP